MLKKCLVIVNMYIENIYIYIYIQYILYTYITKYEVNIVLLGAARFPVHGILLLG